jgi:Protein of unknown function (DUF3501)
MPRVITKNDLMSMAEYGRIRHDHRRKLVAIKRDRRIHIGPYVTLYFENYDTMWSQVHEMLHIERGGDAQIEGELAAFNPLIPQGSELVATMMIEIEDERVRRLVLATLGHIEDAIFLRFGGFKVTGVPENDIDRTTEEGKTSSVHFLHFPFSEEAKAAFQKPGAEVIAGCGHAKYGHMAVMSEDMRASLARDFE